MQPNLDFLTSDLIAHILDEAFQLLQQTGGKVQSAASSDLLVAAGATEGV